MMATRTPRELALDVYKHLVKANARDAETFDYKNDIVQEQGMRMLRVAERVNTNYHEKAQLKFLWLHARAQRQRFHKRAVKDTLSLDLPMNVEGGDPISLYDVIPAEEKTDREPGVDFDRMTACLCDSCKTLIRDILVDGKTFREVAVGQPVSYQRFKQRYDVALERVRGFLTEGASPKGCMHCKKKP